MYIFYLFFQFTMIPETPKDLGSICAIASVRYFCFCARRSAFPGSILSNLFTSRRLFCVSLICLSTCFKSRGELCGIVVNLDCNALYTSGCHALTSSTSDGDIFLHMIYYP